MKTEVEYLKDIGLETNKDFHLSGKTIPELMKGYAKYCHQQKLEEDVCHWGGERVWRKKRYYDTECGEVYVTIDSTFEENKHIYCPFCGKKISLTQEDK